MHLSNKPRNMQFVCSLEVLLWEQHSFGSLKILYLLVVCAHTDLETGKSR